MKTIVVKLRPNAEEQRLHDLIKCREVLNSLTEREESYIAGAWEVPVTKIDHEINDLVCALTLLITKYERGD